MHSEMLEKVRMTPDDGLLRMFADLRPALLRYLLARRATAAEAEDVLQDVYVTLSEAKFGPVAEPRAYLYRTVTNRLLDHRRSAARQSRRDQAWTEVNGGALIEQDDQPSAETQLIGRERLAIVQRYLDMLPERTTSIFRRFRIDGEPQRSIAADLGISVSAVEKHLQQAYRAVVAVKADLDAEPRAARRLMLEGRQ